MRSHKNIPIYSPRTALLLGIVVFFFLPSSTVPIQAQEKPTAGAPQQVGARVYDGKNVRVNVTVTGANSEPVAGLKADDFHLSEDGQAQTLADISSEAVPVLLGVVADMSGSNRTRISRVISVAQDSFRNLRPSDEGFLISFAGWDDIVVERDFTADQNLLVSAADQLFIRPGQTSLFDPLYLAAHKIGQFRSADGTYRRRALILITDGQEQDSYHRWEKVLQTLRILEVQVFVIAFDNNERETRPAFRLRPRELLAKIATETGGQVFYPRKDREFQQAVQTIHSSLRSQYLITYQPKVPPPPGAFRTLQVTVPNAATGEKRRATVRAGYLSPDLP
jgi:VWFA-related protein